MRLNIRFCKALVLSAVLLSLASCDFVSDITGNSDMGGGGPSDAPGFENLGAGYDVFSNYADIEKVRAVIFDTAAMNAAGLIEQKTLEKSVFETSSGTTIEEYASNLQIKASLEGSSMYFSGAVETNFSKSRYERQEYSFATVHSSINKYILRVALGVTAEDMIAFLTDQAKTAINDPAVAPHDLFKVYGTHVLTGIIIGGRLDFNISARTSDLSGSKSIGVYATASFKSAFASATVTVDVLSESEWASFNSSMEMRLEIYGGASEFGQFIINDGEYAQWIESIADNLVFSDFTSSNALLPLWELADTSERKTELKAGLDTWGEVRRIITKPEPTLALLGLDVQESSNPVDTFVGADGLTYTRMPYDLNTGAGGKDIWLYYALGLDDDSSPVFPPINDMYVYNRSDGDPLHGSGFHLPLDLNAGAGGDDIFLAFNRGYGDRIIRGVRIRSSDGSVLTSAGTDAGNTWFDIPEQGKTNAQDLNEGAGGRDIFLAYTYDKIK